MRQNQLNVLPKVFHVDLPTELATELAKCSSEDGVKQLGVEWCTAQAKELKDSGVPSIHFYSLMAVDSVRKVAEAVY